MRSTMMQTPLLISRILQHGATVHGDSEVVTWTGARREPHLLRRDRRPAARLAHALRDDLGVTGDERVATLMWNNAEHVEAYFAVPSMGAVLHTLNLRLLPGAARSTSSTTPRTRSSSSTDRCSRCSASCCRS